MRYIVSGAITLLYDFRIMQEYKLVLSRPKFNFGQSDIDAILRLVETEGVMVNAPPLSLELPDQGDQPFLEVAAARPDVPLVTGNFKHLKGSETHNVQVITPAELLQLIPKSTAR